MVRVDIIDRIEQFQADLTIKLWSSKRDCKDIEFHSRSKTENPLQSLKSLFNGKSIKSPSRHTFVFNLVCLKKQSTKNVHSNYLLNFCLFLRGSLKIRLHAAPNVADPIIFFFRGCLLARILRIMEFWKQGGKTSK